MKTNWMVMFLLVLCTTVVLATSPEPLTSPTCESGFVNWMPGNSPGGSPCTTWTSDSTWTQVQLSDGTWAYYIPDPLTTVSSMLQIGDVVTPFVVNERSVVYIDISKLSLQLKRDGLAPEFYYGGVWHNATEVAYNIGVSPAPTLMTGGELSGQLAYTGTMATPFQIKLDFRGATTLWGASIFLRLRFESDAAVGIPTGGVEVNGIKWWDALLNEPTVSIYADNGYIYLDNHKGDDPRVTKAQVWLNETLLGDTTTLSPHIQIPAVNGTPYTATAQNMDNTTPIPNVSPVATSCTITPASTPFVGMTLALFSKSGADVKASWTVGADNFSLYRSGNPQDLAVLGGGTLIAGGGSATRTFLDIGTLLNNNPEFYRVVAETSGVSERVPEQVQICSAPTF